MKWMTKCMPLPIKRCALQVLRDAVARHFPHANGAMSLAKACMFSNSSDHHFIIDTLPAAQQVDSGRDIVRDQMCLKAVCELLLLKRSTPHTMHMTPHVPPSCGRWSSARRAAATATSSAPSSGRCWRIWRQRAPRGTTSTCTACRRRGPGMRAC